MEIQVKETPKPEFIFRCQHIVKIYEYKDKYYKLVDCQNYVDEDTCDQDSACPWPKIVEVDRKEYFEILRALKDFQQRILLWRSDPHGKR